MKNNIFLKVLTTFIVLMLSTTLSISQTTDTIKLITGFEGAYHNIPVLKAPKSKFYYKNTGVLYSAIGKNFWNIAEAEVGVLKFFWIYSGYIQTRIVIPITSKISYGISGGALGSYNLSVIRDKYNFSTGLNFKTKNAMHSFNANYDYAYFVYFYYSNKPVRKFYGYSMSYNLITNLTNSTKIIFNEKNYIVTIDFLLPDNYGNKDILLSEQSFIFRKTYSKSNLDFGIITFLGKYQKQIKFALFPYLSFTYYFGENRIK